MLTFVPGSFGMALFRLICIRNHFESLNKMTLAKRIILAEILFLGSSVFILPYMVQNHMEDVPVYGRCLNIDSSFVEVIKAYNNLEDYRLARAVRFGIVLVCQVSKLGVPTSKIFLSEQAGGYIFCTVFHKDLKNVNLFKIGSCPSTPKLGLPCLLNFADQAGWALSLGVEGVCLIKKPK